MLNFARQMVVTLSLALGFQLHAAEPLQVVLPSSSGGTTHRVGETFAPLIEAASGRSTYLAFKPGASGLIAARHVLAQKTTDLVFLIGSAYAWPAEADISLSADLEPVAFLGVMPGIAVALPDAPFNTYKEFLEWSKTHTTAYGVGNVCPCIPLFRDIHQLYADPNNLTEVFYKSGGAIVADVLGGHIPVGVTTVDGVLPLIQDHKLKSLGVFGLSRSQLLPQTPTFDEQGLVDPGASIYHYYNQFLWVSKNSDLQLRQTFVSRFNTLLRSQQGKDVLRKLDSRGATGPQKALELLTNPSAFQTLKNGRRK